MVGVGHDADVPVSRRRFLVGASSTAAVVGFLGACADGSDDAAPLDGPPTSAAGSNGASWQMPAEETAHERTWMCWPSSTEVWGTDLPGVQDAIVRIATAIAAFEPVTMLARPDQVDVVQELLGGEVEVLEATVDDLWARDTLPNFVVRERDDGMAELGAGRVRFNGWGDKQIHEGDAQLAATVADLLDIDLIDSGIVGEGGGLEVDGAGTVMAAESSWVNDNRNPGLTREEIEEALLSLLGGERLIWVDGLAGEDITDGHIDTLARFADERTIVVDRPAFDEPGDPWTEVAARTNEQIRAARTADGDPYEVIEVVQPATTRGSGDSFLATYMNYYVCNGAVIAPEFGDADADAAAREVLQGLFPDREIVQVDIDGLAAGGGGIHCATMQQPALEGGS